MLSDGLSSRVFLSEVPFIVILSKIDGEYDIPAIYGIINYEIKKETKKDYLN